MMIWFVFMFKSLVWFVFVFVWSLDCCVRWCGVCWFVLVWVGVFCLGGCVGWLAGLWWLRGVLGCVLLVCFDCSGVLVWCLLIVVVRLILLCLLCVLCCLVLC